MCLVAIAVDAHPRIALVLAANRDEYHARPTAPAAWGHDDAFRDVLAGRDLMAGGTWLGVRRDGRFALVTNVRDGNAQDPAARSRGELPVVALRSEYTIDQATAAIDGPRYNGFNLLVGDAAGFAWMSNRASDIEFPAALRASGLIRPRERPFGRMRRITRGVHGLSNALLDVQWPKVARTQERLQTWLRGDGASLEPLFDALGDRMQASDADLPATGVPLAWERLLSSPFIVSERYGTRCSTVLAVDRGGHARFVERSFAPDGTPAHEVAVEFDLKAPAAAPSPGVESRLP
jgi:uncharacterized protein with NRDE domain